MKRWVMILCLCSMQADRADHTVRQAIDALEWYITWYSLDIPSDIQHGLQCAQRLFPEFVSYVYQVQCAYRRPDAPRALMGIQSLTHHGQGLMRQAIEQLTQARHGIHAAQDILSQGTLSFKSGCARSNCSS